MLTIGDSGSGKINLLFNSIIYPADIDKVYSNAKDPYEAKYKLWINKREIAGLNHLNDCKAFIKYSNHMNDIYKNIEEYKPNTKCKTLFVFDDVIADTLTNKSLNPVINQLFIWGRKLSIFLVFFFYVILFCCVKKY